MNIQEKNSWVIKIEESNKMMIKIRMIYKIKNEKNQISLIFYKLIILSQNKLIIVNYNTINVK